MLFVSVIPLLLLSLALVSIRFLSRCFSISAESSKSEDGNSFSSTGFLKICHQRLASVVVVKYSSSSMTIGSSVVVVFGGIVVWRTVVWRTVVCRAVVWRRTDGKRVVLTWYFPSCWKTKRSIQLKKYEKSVHTYVCFVQFHSDTILINTINSFTEII